MRAMLTVTWMITKISLIYFSFKDTISTASNWFQRILNNNKKTVIFNRKILLSDVPVPYDGEKELRFETGAADQGAVNVRHLHEVFGVLRLYTASV